MPKLFRLVVLALVGCARSDALSATSDGKLTKLTTPNGDQGTQSEQDGKRVLRAISARTLFEGQDGVIPYITTKTKARYGAARKAYKKLGHKKTPVEALVRREKPFGSWVMDTIISAKNWVVKHAVAFWRFITLSKKKKK